MRRRDRAHAWRTAAALLFAAACTPAPSHDEPAPVGLAAFEERLATAAGVPASAGRLVVRASEAREAFGRRLDRLAHRLDPDADWHAVFDRLSRDGPDGVDELLASYRTELDRAADFVRRHDLVTVPEESLPVVEAQNVALRSLFPLALYLDGKLAVTTAAGLDPDPAYLANHCSVCIPPLAVHEGYPGHHVAFTLMRPPAAPPSDAAAGEAEASAPRRRLPYNRLLIEGWGLYAELLMLEQGYYDDDPARALGAWRMLLLRALRAEVDVKLHLREIDEETAVVTYVDELGMTPDAARTEVRRHLAEPTMKASYFAGLLQILELRRRHLDSEPGATLKSFHDRLLRAAGKDPAATVADVARRAFGVELGELGGEAVDWYQLGARVSAARDQREGAAREPPREELPPPAPSR